MHTIPSTTAIYWDEAYVSIKNISDMGMIHFNDILVLALYAHSVSIEMALIHSEIHHEMDLTQRIAVEDHLPENHGSTRAQPLIRRNTVFCLNAGAG